MSLTGEALAELHRIHRQLADLRNRRERGPKQVKAHEANVAQLEQQRQQAMADSRAAQMAADQKQLQLRSNEDKVHVLQAKLSACSTNREYQALTEQIAADKMAASVLEDEILEALGKIDEMKSAIATATEHLAKGKEELEKTKKSVAAGRESIEADITRLQALLVTAEAALPADFRGEYDRIVRVKHDDAMAEVEGNICGGCYRQITPNMVNYLTMSHIIYCKSCGRLLYLKSSK
jgi:hypothetical protein